MAPLNLSQIAIWCQQDLLELQKKQEETASMRLELASLTKRQDEIQAECTVSADEITGYDEQWRDLAQFEHEIQRDSEALKARHEALQAEYQKIVSEQKTSLRRPAPADEEEDRLFAAQYETEAVIAQNLAKREDVTVQLTYLSELADLEQQNEKLQATVITREFELQRIEAEKTNLVKALSLLIEHKQDAYVLLSGKREEQIIAVAQYNQDLTEFVAVVQQVACQEQAPINHFLNQDISRLLELINIIKQRQYDLKSTAFEKITQLRELSYVLNDTAKDYGLTTSDLQSDTQDVVVNYQTISHLRQEINDLLWVTPPGILAKLGLCTQWKKTLLDLLIKAKSMEERADSPAVLREQTIAEIDKVLLECRHLTQRIYEACYRQLLDCGHSIEHAYNQCQEELAALTKQLLSSRKETQDIKAKMDPNPVNDVLELQQSLGKIEHTLEQAQYKLQQQKSALAERQGLLQENDIMVVPRQREQQNRLEDLSRQVDNIEKQRTDNTNRLQESRQRLTELEDVITVACGKLEKLVCEQDIISSRIKTSTAHLAESVSPDNKIRVLLAEEWINRIQKAQYQPECNVGMTDIVSGVTPAETLLGKKSLEIENIAQRIVAEQAGMVVLETREWQLPVAVIAVEFRLDGYRRYNLIEEFIMKCISCGLAELCSQQGIVGLLRVEEVAVSYYLSELVRCHLLSECEVGGAKNYELTDKGRKVVLSGLFAATPRNGAVVIAVNAQYELIDTCKQLVDNLRRTEQSLPVFRYSNQQEELALRSYFQIEDEDAKSIAQEMIKEWYTGDLEEYKTIMYDAQRKQDSYLRFGEIWMYDVINNQIVCHVWNFDQQAFCPKLEFVLNSLEGEQRFKEVQAAYLQGLFLKKLEVQLLNGYLADEEQCITWFYAMLRLSEHSYVREILAEEAVEKVIANHSDRTLFKLLAVYVKVDVYEFGFSRLLVWLAGKQESHTKLIYWLEKLRTRNPKAHSNITTAFKTTLRRAR
ncbi:hypothetical protein SPSIL_049400 [Sporomusa silvacetica DSM 10669]|uniref:Chromosome partition protein Smc n=1 Tax=Sporomusa silvacetica DSM 10669 TaxID=1123289 RepID=A0ABZ3ISQ4_9FIRM|nr:hypothetical protein [Sporomusa silvacetica]OZC15419.1 hypothetical protein SPSIL_41200 [Sporomusa silvacetica DSM 10669]